MTEKQMIAAILAAPDVVLAARAPKFTISPDFGKAPRLTAACRAEAVAALARMGKPWISR